MNINVLRNGRVLGFRFVIIMALASQAVPSPASGQTSDSIAELLGKRIRVHMCGDVDDIIGRLEGFDATMLQLRTTDTLINIPRFDLQRWDVSSRDRGLWAQIGLFTGAAVGALAYTIWSNTQYTYNDFAPLTAVFVAAPIGGLVGAPIGAIAAPERWRLGSGTIRQCPTLRDRLN